MIVGDHWGAGTETKYDDVENWRNKT